MSKAVKTPEPHTVWVHGCPVRKKSAVHNGVCKTKRCGRDEKSCIAYQVWTEAENKEKGINNEA